MKMMFGRRLFFLMVVLGCVLCRTAAAEPAAEWQQAQLYTLTAWFSLASYDDRLGEVARQELKNRGWQLEPFREDQKNIAARFLLFSHSEGAEHAYFLSVPGTEGKSDVMVDLNFGKVHFAGSTPEEFVSEAAEEVTAEAPQVHGGFNAYTQAAFFNKKDASGRTFGEYLAEVLLAQPQRRLYITGHSLGGAVSTLLAARLAAMGVPAEQLHVVTYGAPAVGNEAFAAGYEDKFTLDRITIAGDPVKGVLQTLQSGYKQFGHHEAWQQSKTTDKFPHNMTVYADAALRNLYDVQQHLQQQGYAAEVGRYTQLQQHVYVMPFVFSLPEKLQDDQKYMELAQKDVLQDCVTDISYAEGDISLAAACREAKKQGCQYILQETVRAQRSKNELDNYQIELAEIIYDTEGNVLSLQTNVTNTGTLTPLEAVVYNQMMAQEKRTEVLH